MIEYGESGGVKFNMEKKIRIHGNPLFYSLLEEMADLHEKKSHDYASNTNTCGNYHFAGMLSQLFTNCFDAGFVGRLGEKMYRLANLENSGKSAMNESIEDTELDLCVIMLLWISDRRTRRENMRIIQGDKMEQVINDASGV